MSKIGSLARNLIRPSPFHYVMLVAAAVLFVSVGSRLYFGGGGLDVRFRERRAPAGDAQRAAADVGDRIYYGDDSAHARYSERLRDASQIAVALGLFTVRERTGFNRVLPDIDAVLSGLDKSPLKPPVVTSVRLIRYGASDVRGLLLTDKGAYYVSYRPRPLAFEILAAGEHGLDDGAVFVVRLPEATGTIIRGQAAQPAPGSYATVFVAPYRNAAVPVPFSPPDVYRRAGWGQEPLRAAPFSEQEMAEINRFLADVPAPQ